MHRSEELSFPLWYEAAVVVTTICYIRFPSIKMPSGTVKTAGEYDTEFVYLSPCSILHPRTHTHTHTDSKCVLEVTPDVHGLFYAGGKKNQKDN